MNERIMKHAGKDSKSHMLKPTLQSGHPSVSPNNFTLLHKWYNNSNVKRKISEALLIRKHRLPLNIHETSVPLELFNWNFGTWNLKHETWNLKPKTSAPLELFNILNHLN